MLLRASRIADLMTKEAFLGRLAGAGLGLVGKAAKGVGRTAMKHPMGSLAVAAGGTAGGMEAVEGFKAGRNMIRRQGMNRPINYMRTRRFPG